MLFRPPRLTDSETRAIERIDQLREQLRYATRTPKRWMGHLRREAFARAVRGSNSIEGYNVSIEDAVAAGEREEPFDAEDETWVAITGYREALTYIMQLAEDPDFSYSTALIRSLHFMMLSYSLEKNPGQWRPGAISVFDEQRRQIVYEAPDAGQVPPLMRELAESLNEPDDTPAIVRAAMAHLNLAMIHPFSDGNGRMARALQSLVLVREGILTPTFSSIEEWLGRRQGKYYEVLETVGNGLWHPEHDALPWVRFCLQGHYECAHRLRLRIREIEKIWPELENLAELKNLPDRVVVALVAATYGQRVRNPIYRKLAEVSEQTASRDLKQLADMKLLAPHGERRGRSYVATEMLLQLREKTKESWRPPDPFALEEPMLPFSD